MSKNKHIFLSYRSVEVDFALKLAADLKNAGVNLWMDRMDIKPGADWPKALASAVNDCAAMISILSPEYVTSKYCQRELARADRMGRPIFPLLLRSIPATDWPIEVERQQFIDFSEWREDTAYHQQLQKLVEIIKKHTADQISAIPDPETRYLTSLIAELEAPNGLMEFVELSAQDDQPVGENGLRPRPRFAKIWTMHGAFDLLEKLPHAPQKRRIPLNGIREALDKFTRFVLIGAPGMGKSTTLHHLVLDAAHARQLNPQSAPLPFYLKLASWSEHENPADFIRAQWQLDSDPIRLLARGDIILFLDGLSEIGSLEKISNLRAWLHSENAPERVIITCRADDYQPEIDLGLPIVQAAEMDAPRIQQFVKNYLGEAETTQFLAKVMPEPQSTTIEDLPYYRLARHPFLLNTLLLIFRETPGEELPRTAGALMRQLVINLWERKHAQHHDDWVSLEELETCLTALAFEMTDQAMQIYVPIDVAVEFVGTKSLLEAAARANFLEIQGIMVRFSHHLLQEYFAALGLAKVGVPTRLMRPRFNKDGARIASKWDAPMIMLAGLVPEVALYVQDIAEVNPLLAVECIINGAVMPDHIIDQIVKQLMSLMTIDEQDGRAEAIHLLAMLKHEAAIPILLDTLREGAWEVRCAAHLVLQEIRIDPLPGLTQAIRELEHDIRGATATALRQLGETAIPTLLQLLQDEQWFMRRNAAWALGESKDPAAVPALVYALHDSDNLVCTEAATALGWIRDEAAIPWLLIALKHENWRVRKATASALSWMGAAVVPQLLTELRSENAEIKRLAVEVLKNIHDPATVPVLLEVSYDENVEVRSLAIDAFKNVEDSMVVKRLIQSLEDTASARWNKQRICDTAAEALESIGTVEALTAVDQWRRGSNTEEAPMRSKNNKGKSKTAAQAKEHLLAITNARNLTDQLNRLKSKNWSERRDAVLALAVADASIAVPRLMAALKDDENQVRIAAVKSLGAFRNEAAIWGLLQALGDEDYLVCDAATEALKTIGKPAIPGLMGASRSENKNTRAAAVEVLGKIGDPTAIPRLKERLKDDEKPWLSDERIRDMALRALEAIGTPESLQIVRTWREKASPTPNMTLKEAVDASVKSVDVEQRELLQDLLEKLHDDEWSIRQDAAKALREYAKKLRGTRDARIAESLIYALDDLNWEVRWAAAEALAWIGDSNAVDALLRCLADDNWMVRMAVIRALIEIGDAKAMNGILASLNDEKNVVREAAAEALGVFGVSDAAPGLIGALNDPERFVRLAAVEAMGKIKNPEVIQHLIVALDDSDNNVRWAAAEALGKIGDDRAVKPLIRHLDDTEGPQWEEKRVCDVVAEALRDIGTPEATDAVEKWRQRQIS